MSSLVPGRAYRDRHGDAVLFVIAVARRIPGRTAQLALMLLRGHGGPWELNEYELSFDPKSWIEITGSR